MGKLLFSKDRMDKASPPTDALAKIIAKYFGAELLDFDKVMKRSEYRLADKKFKFSDGRVAKIEFETRGSDGGARVFRNNGTFKYDTVSVPKRKELTNLQESDLYIAVDIKLKAFAVCPPEHILKGQVDFCSTVNGQKKFPRFLVPLDCWDFYIIRNGKAKFVGKNRHSYLRNVKENHKIGE